MASLTRSLACWLERDSVLILDHLGKPSLKCNFSRSPVGCAFDGVSCGVLCGGMCMNWDGTGFRWSYSERKRDIWTYVVIGLLLVLFFVSSEHLLGTYNWRPGSKAPPLFFSCLRVLWFHWLDWWHLPLAWCWIGSESFHYISCGLALPRF